MSKRWHLTQIFYAWHPDATDDHIGNHLLIHLVRPLFAQLKQTGQFGCLYFNRFAQAGHHIQLLIQIDIDQQLALESTLRATLDAYLLAHADLFDQEQMHLTPLSQRIQHESPLHRPGTYTMHFFDPQQQQVIQALYENDTLQAHDDLWQDFLSQMWLTLLAQEVAPHARIHVLRLWLVYYFWVNRVSLHDQAIVLTFLIRQWTRYFHIEAEFSRHIAPYHQNPQPYHTYFGQIAQQPEAMADVLPARFRPFFRHAQQRASALVQKHPLLVSLADGHLTDYSLLRCFGVFHTNHNRLAIDIFKELFWAYAMLQQVLPALSPNTSPLIEQAVERLSQYFLPA